MSKLRRIACDWDFKEKTKAINYIKKIFNKGFEKLEIRKSTRKGFHVFIWTFAKGDRFKLREQFGDDKRHIMLDKLHPYARQTNFYVKKKFKRSNHSLTERGKRHERRRLSSLQSQQNSHRVETHKLEHRQTNSISDEGQENSRRYFKTNQR